MKKSLLQVLLLDEEAIRKLRAILSRLLIYQQN